MNHLCPNPSRVATHIFGEKNAGACSLCTGTYEQFIHSGNRAGLGYYERIWAFYEAIETASDKAIETCVSELSRWLEPQPQECRKHECVENRAEIERHHNDFAKISEICSFVLKYCDTPGHEAFRQAVKDIRNIVG